MERDKFVRDMRLRLLEAREFPPTSCENEDEYVGSPWSTILARYVTTQIDAEEGSPLRKMMSAEEVIMAEQHIFECDSCTDRVTNMVLSDIADPSTEEDAQEFEEVLGAFLEDTRDMTEDETIEYMADGLEDEED